MINMLQLSASIGRRHGVPGLLCTSGQERTRQGVHMGRGKKYQPEQVVNLLRHSTWPCSRLTGQVQLLLTGQCAHPAPIPSRLVPTNAHLVTYLNGLQTESHAFTFSKSDKSPMHSPRNRPHGRIVGNPEQNVTAET